MPYREVTVVEIKEVLRLWLRGVPKKRIAAQLGLNPKTVRRYAETAAAHGLAPAQGEQALTDERLAAIVAALRAPPEREHGGSWALCVKHREVIAKLLEGGVLLTKTRKLLARRHGADVPYSTLHRFATTELDFGRAAITLPVADCEPGEEVQLDTGWVGWIEGADAKRCRFRAWIFTSVFSRLRFVYPCFRETTETAIEACEAAWEFFGGVFRVVIPDNTRVIVAHADPLAPRFNVAFLEYAQARGFEIDTTRVRRPKDKARVERSVPHVRDDCFGGERLASIEAARAHTLSWCWNDYGMRRHTRTRRLPRELFEAEERARLRPAPESRYDVPVWSDATVGGDQFAQVAQALYSLPRKLVGEKLRARVDRSTVRFYRGAVLVRVHARIGPGERQIERSDFPAERLACAQRDAGFVETEAAKHGPSVARFARALLQGPLPWTRLRRAFALLALVKRHGAARVDDACARALDADMLDVKRLDRMLQVAAPPEPASTRAAPLASKDTTRGVTHIMITDTTRGVANGMSQDTTRGVAHTMSTDTTRGVTHDGASPGVAGAPPRFLRPASDYGLAGAVSDPRKEMERTSAF